MEATDQKLRIIEIVNQRSVSIDELVGELAIESHVDLEWVTEQMGSYVQSKEIYKIRDKYVGERFILITLFNKIKKNQSLSDIKFDGLYINSSVLQFFLDKLIKLKWIQRSGSGYSIILENCLTLNHLKDFFHGRLEKLGIPEILGALDFEAQDFQPGVFQEPYQHCRGLLDQLVDEGFLVPEEPMQYGWRVDSNQTVNRKGI